MGGEVMRRIFGSIAVILGLVANSGTAMAQLVPVYARPPQLAREETEALRLADAWLDSIQAYQHIPAISAGVVSSEQLVWAKGYGTIDADHHVAATPQTIYSICSISKLFTSVALMQLYERGKVRLDEPLTTYLPWATLKPSDADSGPITLRAVLSHSAGLPRESDFPYWSPPSFTFPTRQQLRDMIGKQAPYYPASRYFQYSNLGLTLIGETVEAVSGQPYADYIRSKVLAPLQLADTRPFMPMDLYGKRLAVGYGALKRDGGRDLLPAFDARAITPAAGFTSTVEDLAAFATWQFRLLRTEKADVLKASTLREMQRVQFVDPDWKTTRGLGFSIVHSGNRTYVGHAGDCPGYQTVLRMEPSTGRAVIILDNAAEQPSAWAAGIFALLDKRDRFVFRAPAAAGINPEEYAGHYSLQPWHSEQVVVPWAGGLAIASLPSDNPAEGLALLKPKGGNVFRRVRDDGSEAEEVRFERDASGKVVRLIQDSNIAERIAPGSAR